MDIHESAHLGREIIVLIDSLPFSFASFDAVCTQLVSLQICKITYAC
jgi:hypothetical protein